MVENCRQKLFGAREEVVDMLRMRREFADGFESVEESMRMGDAFAPSNATTDCGPPVVTLPIASMERRSRLVRRTVLESYFNFRDEQERRGVAL